MTTGFYVTFNIWMAVAVLMLFIGVEGKLFPLLCVLAIAAYDFYWLIRGKSNYE